MEAQALQLGSLALRDCCHIGGLLHPYVSGDLPTPELEVGWDQEANGFVGLNWRSEPQQHCWRMLLLPRIVCVCAPGVIAYLKLKLCSLCGGGGATIGGWTLAENRPQEFQQQLELVGFLVQFCSLSRIPVSSALYLHCCCCWLHIQEPLLLPGNLLMCIWHEKPELRADEVNYRKLTLAGIGLRHVWIPRCFDNNQADVHFSADLEQLR